MNGSLFNKLPIYMKLKMNQLSFVHVKTLCSTECTANAL